MLSFGKTNEPIPGKLLGRRKDGRTDGRRDRQTLFYGTLRAKVMDSTTSLQQVTGGNTSNLVLKRMLSYFLKIQPLKKILQF